MKAPEQNQALARIAELLRLAEQDSGPEFLPQSLNVMGLFRDFVLPSSRTMEKLSYGDPLFRMPTQSNIPITADREYAAEVLGMAPAGVAAGRATSRVANEVSDQLVKTITGNPQATAPAVLEAAGQMAPLSRIFSPEQAKKIIPKTKVVDESGNPKLMYHGTAQNIQEFDPGKSGASFVSPEPSFAGNFAQYGEQRSSKKLAESIDENPDQKRAFLEPIIEEAMKIGKLTSKDFPDHQKMAQAGFIKNLDMYTKDYWLEQFSDRPLYNLTDVVGIGKEVTDALVSRLEVGRNVLPLYVDVKKPFDYEKKSHVDQVMRALSKEDPDFYAGTTRGRNLKRALQSGSWDDIENTDVQQAIKDLGFDGFYVKEQGVKNLGVFDPSKIRSAISDPDFERLLEPETASKFTEDVFSNPLMEDTTK